MTPQELEKKVRAQQQKQEQEQLQQQNDAYNQSLQAKRYVSLFDTPNGKTLQINGLGYRSDIGWALVLVVGCLGWLPFIFEWWGLPLGALLMVGIWFLFTPRTLYRIMLTDRNFAIFKEQAKEPYLFGRMSSTEMMPYSWRGDNGILVRAYDLASRDNTFTGVSHPEDLALIKQFCTFAQTCR